MAFVLYRSPAARPGHLGESLRTRSVANAWARVGRFLARCTDDPPPRSVTLRVDRAVDEDGAAAAIVDELARELGPSTAWQGGDERGWEWTDASRLPEIVAACERYETRERIHVNAAVRRHASPKTPRVWATVAYEIAVRCGRADTHAYPPGWGTSQLRAYLGFNEVWLVLHLPFERSSPALEQAVGAMEAALEHPLSRARLEAHAR